jgi:hypothetical protein
MPWKIYQYIKQLINISWMEKFDVVYPHISSFYKNVTKNIKIFHECKESKDVDMIMK